MTRPADAPCSGHGPFQNDRAWVEHGDSGAYMFSRNATALVVSVKQYSRRNAVQALMIVAAILVFLDEAHVGGFGPLVRLRGDEAAGGQYSPDRRHRWRR